MYGGELEQADLLPTDHVGGEHQLSPGQGGAAGGRRWREYDSPEAVVNLRAGFDGEILNGVAGYAAVYVHSPTARDILLDTPEMVDLHLGSDDGIRVWLNGNLLHKADGNREWRADQDCVRGLPLRRGWNLLLLKFSQRGWEWKMSVRILDSRGLPVPGLQFAFVPSRESSL